MPDDAIEFPRTGQDHALVRCVFGEAALFQPPLFPITDDDFHASLRRPLLADLPADFGAGEAW